MADIIEAMVAAEDAEMNWQDSDRNSEGWDNRLILQAALRAALEAAGYRGAAGTNPYYNITVRLVSAAYPDREPVEAPSECHCNCDDPLCPYTHPYATAHGSRRPTGRL